jgi:tRNA-uridine 2-sulfurtransferase
VLDTVVRLCTTSERRFQTKASTVTILAQDHIDGLHRTLPKGSRVVVAMSGGVDSSVAAALLKHAGYDVVGITLQLYDHGAAVGKAGSCCAGQDVHDARNVAEQLGIPHYVLDYESRFKKAVVDTFAASYAAGETPIPCVACNSQIKFLELLDTARELGASMLATGHYIRREADASGAAMYRAVDAARDQSYFLFATTAKQLAQLMFPIGGLPKALVRELADHFNLPVATKPDSQDICFVPSGRYSDVIEKLRPDAIAPGKFVHVDGRVLGDHAGIINFTVGQRRGIGIAAAEPLYVIRLDAARREVVVGPRTALEVRDITLRDVNWIGQGSLDDIPLSGLDIFVRVRSSQPLLPATFYPGPKTSRIKLVVGEFSVAPGQACVFYDGLTDAARVLGGGWIMRPDAQQFVARALQSPVSVDLPGFQP